MSKEYQSDLEVNASALADEINEVAQDLADEYNLEFKDVISELVEVISKKVLGA